MTQVVQRYAVPDTPSNRRKLLAALSPEKARESSGWSQQTWAGMIGSFGNDPRSFDPIRHRQNLEHLSDNRHRMTLGLETVNYEPPRPAQTIEQLVAAEVMRIEVRDTAKMIVDAKRNPPVPIVLHTLADLQNVKQIEWWVEGILPKSSVVVVAGDGGVGKSAMLIEMSARLATGTPFLGTHHTRTARVLYIPGEGYAGYGPRLQSVQLEHVEMPPPSFTLASAGVRLTTAASVSTLCSLVREGEYDVVVLDTLSTLASLESENDAAEVARVMQACQDISNARPGCTVILVHHTNKGEGKVRGSSVIRDNADVLWILKGESNAFTMSNKTSAGGKMKDGAPLEIRGLALRPAHGSVVVERDAEVAETPVERRARKILEAMIPGMPFSTSNLYALINTVDQTAGLTTVKRIVNEMTNAGQIVKQAHGIYQRPLVQ